MAWLLKKPAGFLPPAISAVLLILIVLDVQGGARSSDEGTAAHLFQILMPLQAGIIGYFALTWLPKQPRTALPIMALHVGAAAAVLATVLALHL